MKNSSSISLYTFEKKSSYPQNNLVEKECFPVVLSVTRLYLPAVSDIPVASAGNKRVFNLLVSLANLDLELAVLMADGMVQYSYYCKSNFSKLERAEMSLEVTPFGELFR